jgi:ferric-dicitrate binding protein FerR (iron transport regulator)
MHSFMKQQENHMIADQLLVRFLLDEADTAERETVRRWLEASEANREYYETFVSAAACSTPAVDTGHIDLEAEWRSFKAGIPQRGAPAEGKVVTFRRQLLRIAAIFLLMAGMAAYLLTRNNAGSPVEFASGSQVLTATLPDGSVITLNKRSSLHYNSSYNSKDRDVQLSGEAFFAVTPNRELPFIIRTGEVQVEVLGTSFNVREAPDKTEIIVETGKVRVKKGNVTAYLQAGEKAVLYNDKQEPVKQLNADPLYSYYRTKQFVCNGTPLRELVAALNNSYDQQIVLADPKDGGLPITTTFVNKTTSEIVAVICATLQLTAIQQGDTIILKKRNP